MTENKQPRGVVLAVDDSPDALSMVHDALEASGLDVLVALDGKQALKIAARMTPDIILLDALMPNLDGFQTCKALKENPALSDVPVIFMTGLGDSEDIVKGLESGGVDYLVKPIRPDELVARINVHLNNARLTRSAHAALDQAGQVLLSVDVHAHVQWATPAAYSLMAKASLTDLADNPSVSAQVRQWLLREPQIGHALKLEGLDYPLTFKLAAIEQACFVIKVIDGNQLAGPSLLRNQLNLTERESEVIYWIANGKTNREAAEILAMSPRTVNKHLEQIFLKLQVDNRTSAAGMALKILVTAEGLS